MSSDRMRAGMDNELPELQDQTTASLDEWYDPSNGILKAMFEAVEDGDVEVLERLLQQLQQVGPALIDILGPEGDTLLHLACLYAHEECFKLLMNHNASVAVRDEDDSSVLHDASASGNLNIVRALVDRSPDLINAVDSDGDQPLHNAARGGHTDVVQFLLLEGATPHALNHKRETPRLTCGDDIEAGVHEALEIAERQWQDDLGGTVPEPGTPPKGNCSENQGTAS